MADDTITVQIDEGSEPFIASTTLSEPATVLKVTDIGDVDSTTLDNGAILVYKTATSKWVSTTTLESQNLEGGFY
jgi:hypothetical protein